MNEQDVREPLVRLRDEIEQELARWRTDIVKAMTEVERLESALQQVDQHIAVLEVVSKFDLGSLGVSSAVDALLERFPQSAVQVTGKTPKQTEPATAANSNADSADVRVDVRRDPPRKPPATAAQRTLIDYVLDMELHQNRHQRPRTGLLAKDVDRLITEYFGIHLLKKASARQLSKLVNQEKWSNVRCQNHRYWRETESGHRPRKSKRATMVNLE